MFIQYRAKSLTALWSGCKPDEITTCLEIGEFVGLSYDYDLGAATIALNDFDDLLIPMPVDKYSEFVFSIYKKLKEFNVVALTSIGFLDDIDYDTIDDVSKVKEKLEACYGDDLNYLE